MTEEQKQRLASLTPDQERKIKEIEDSLGDVYVIAYEQPLVPAHLEESELQVLQQAEEELPGIVLVAYQKA
ncbi:MAG: hypothetical protein GX774_18055 [Armatimonadetes bacterium]|jgi:hypothetical protein|nr:hypothetical protein [Armatimonadota bacterium]